MKSWMDVSYESIPRENTWTRVYWRQMELLYKNKSMTVAEAHARACEAVTKENHPELHFEGLPCQK